MNWLLKTILNQYPHNIDIIVEKFKTESARTEAPVEGYITPDPNLHIMTIHIDINQINSMEPFIFANLL